MYTVRNSFASFQGMLGKQTWSLHFHTNPIDNLNPYEHIFCMTSSIKKGDGSRGFDFGNL